MFKRFSQLFRRPAIPPQGRPTPTRSQDGSRQQSLRDAGEPERALFARARELHQNGKLDDALTIYRSLHRSYADDFDLCFLISMALGQRGDLSQALDYVEKALHLDPNRPEALTCQANCLAGLGKNDAAVAIYDRALALQPGNVESLNNRGSALRSLHRLEDALLSYDRALAIEPTHVVTLDNRGVVLRDLKRHEEALASHHKALSLDSQYTPALANYARLLNEMQRFSDARNAYDQLLNRTPNDVEALIQRSILHRHLNCRHDALRDLQAALCLSPKNPVAYCYHAVVLHELGHDDEALANLDKALSLKRDYVEALINRGSILRELGRPEDAIESLDHGLRHDPNNAPAHFCRGVALGDLNRFEDALNAYDQAIALKNNYVEAYNNRGTMLRALRRHEDALASYAKAVAINAEHSSLLFNRGNLLADLERQEDAVKDFSRLVKIDPNYKFARGHLLQAKLSCCDWHQLDALVSEISIAIQNGACSAEPFSCIGIVNSPALLKQCAEIYVREKFPSLGCEGRLMHRPHNDRIRLGYVAGEFRNHATAFLMAGLFEAHDKNRFEVYAFDNGWNDGSAMRKRLESAFTDIIDISRMSDREAATEVANRRIDILVDLNGHVGHKRTGIFRHRPAPIQVNWLGFPGTIGADYIDYILADATVIPAEDEIYYSEKVVRLSACYQVNDPKRRLSERTPTRAEAGLPEKAFVFCSFNNPYKITPPVFDVWMRLLKKVEGSVLWLLASNTAVSRNLRSEAAARGVSADRLVFAQRTSLADHLARHRLADLFLDTLPCNAHTTASDALWAGLPVLTCLGSTFAGRVAASLLSAIGLPELVTESLDEYEKLALSLANNPPHLKELRVRLANNLTTQPLFDVERFRRDIEFAYIAMHERWSRGEPPIGFDVMKLHTLRTPFA